MLSDRVAAIKAHIRHHDHRCWTNLDDLRREVEHLEDEVAELEADRPHLIPASAGITAFLKGSTIASTTFPSGATINLVGDVKNTAGTDIPNSVSWSADQGTLTPDPTNPELATLVNVPDGTVTVTMTTTNGIVAQHAYVVADLTPASADFTASAS